LPYLVACAFIANAASFVLPISNPANLVLYGNHIPALWPWLKQFALPSMLSIAATYAVLRFLFRNDPQGKIEYKVGVSDRSDGGRYAAYGIAATAVALLLASALDTQLGADLRSRRGNRRLRADREEGGAHGSSCAASPGVSFRL
jgi:arsenical pump membrane protein